MTLVALRLERNGTVEVAASGDSSKKCGPPAATVMHYRVTIDCADNSLDDNGFIIDHSAVFHFMRRRWSTVRDFVSCERIALDSVYGLLDMMHEHGTQVRAISVSISASPGVASMTASWPGPDF